jgi:hypothetical protein
MNNDDKNNSASNHNPALSGYFPNLRVVQKIYKYGKKQSPENEKRSALREHIMTGGTPKEFSEVRSWHPTTAGKMLQLMGIKKVFITEEEHAHIINRRKANLNTEASK